MSAYRYPQNDLDEPEVLLDLLGSFWATTYQGNGLVRDLVATTGQMAQQTYQHLLELVSCISRFQVPLYHQDNWYALTVSESSVNTDLSLRAQYVTPATHSYTSGNPINYGQILPRSNFSVAKPKDLQSVNLIFNRLTSPTVELCQGFDYWLTEATITFVNNPFANPLIAKRDILDETGAIVDRELVLWLYRGKWDWKTVYEQFGYVLRLQLKTSEGYKQFLNAIFDALAEGTSARAQQLALSAAFGVPLVIEATETVETIVSDQHWLHIITNRHVYRFSLPAVAVVAVGDVVRAGDSLTDLFRIFELNRGTKLAPTDVSAVTIGAGVLAAGYWGDLTFANKELPLVVAANIDGYTKVSWQLGGFPYDVEKFWTDVHTAGVAREQTLAMLLDVRETPVDQPIAASLPATINPLQFLVDNLLRNNAYLVKVRPGSTLARRLPYVPADQLRKIQPPHTLMLLIVELSYQDQSIRMESPGTEIAPGYVEEFRGFPCMIVADALNPASSITEQIRVSLIGGRCI